MATLYTLLSVLAVSAFSLVGLFVFSLGKKRETVLIPLLVSLAVGALLGDAFIHLIPEALEADNSLLTPLAIIGGIFAFFLLEHVLHWHHHTEKHDGDHRLENFGKTKRTRINAKGYVILTSDTLHNAIDGAIIGASYMMGIEIGLATTVAIILHEIPQEIGDFGVLLQAGFTKARALAANFISALFAFIGAIAALAFGGVSEAATGWLLPVAAGGFIYIAGADLIPELHKTKNRRVSILQAVAVLLGVGAMVLLRIFGE